MKKIYLLSLLVLVLISSCGGDDTPKNVVDSNLVGTWSATSFILSDCEDEADNESRTNLVCTTFECIQFTFTDNSEYIAKTIENSFETRSDGSYSADNGVLRITSPDQDISGTYTVVGDVFTYTYELSGCTVQFIMDRI